MAHVKEKLDDPTLAWFCLFVSAVVLITRIILKLNPSPAALPPPPVASSAKAVPAYRAASGCLPLDEVCAARMLSESEGVSHFEDVSTHAFYSLMSQVRLSVLCESCSVLLSVGSWHTHSIILTLSIILTHSIILTLCQLPTLGRFSTLDPAPVRDVPHHIHRSLPLLLCGAAAVPAQARQAREAQELPGDGAALGAAAAACGGTSQRQR